MGALASLTRAIARSASSLFLACGLVTAASAALPVYPDVDPNLAPNFPRDFGAHPAYRTEWWYVTGWLTTADGDELGFQVTFFRARVPTDEANPSRFAPKQMLFAHAAIVDPKLGRSIVDQRIARTGFGHATFSDVDTDLKLGDWTLVRVDDGPGKPGAPNPPLRFRTVIKGERFSLELDLHTTDAILMQGADPTKPGYSQKGPAIRDASRYFSIPQLQVEGRIARPTSALPDATTTNVDVKGTAWLDREWSSAYLNPQAVGWDWMGLNLNDGGALMLFQIRDRKGGILWSGGARRFTDGSVERYSPGDIGFTTTRLWDSKVSGTSWPIGQSVTIAKPPNDKRTNVKITPLSFTVEPLVDNQEIDARLTTGTIYWEGAIRASTNDARGRVFGRGYLELTGYWRPMKF
jgi:predicted secreted hydrolase